MGRGYNLKGGGREREDLYCEDERWRRCTVLEKERVRL